ncbi:hypothetical protein GCM10008942_21220 [Rhizomicrobium electricum]|uniref:Uncharacterized protein n=1 Tax=Rhizomicrobium electricum TaxID=480070 RepID=A0ABN1EQZ1_9PROT
MAAIPGIAGALKNPGKGVVTLVVPGGPGEEVEIALPKRHQVTSALKDVLRVIPAYCGVGLEGIFARFKPSPAAWTGPDRYNPLCASIKLSLEGQDLLTACRHFPGTLPPSASGQGWRKKHRG